MKKLLPIVSLALCSAMMQNCSQRDEDFVHETNISENLQDHHLMRRDSARSSDEHLDPDPPVRDGDDWRIAPKK